MPELKKLAKTLKLLQGSEIQFIPGVSELGGAFEVPELDRFPTSGRSEGLELFTEVAVLAQRGGLKLAPVFRIIKIFLAC
jgi:hypothetical protein